MSSQQQTYQGMIGMQQSQGQSLLSNQRSNMGGQMQSMMGVQQSQSQSLLSNQRGNMGSQMQGLMTQYTSLPSYQVSGNKRKKKYGEGKGPWKWQFGKSEVNSCNLLIPVIV